MCCCSCCCRRRCHNLLKGVNDFPTRTVPVYWQICVKFGTQELHIIPFSSCQFPANRTVKDTLYVGGWYELHHSFYIFHRISARKTAHVMSTKIWVTVRFVKSGAGIYIYILHKCVNELVLLLSHWLPDLCEIRREKSAQNAADYLWVFYIPAKGRPYICREPTFCVYRTIGTFLTRTHPNKPGVLSNKSYSSPVLHLKAALSQGCNWC